MKINEINGIIHDLLELESWKNPLGMIWIKNKFEIDLITGKTNQIDKDSLTEIYLNKRKWFIQRVKKLNGNLKDFQKAKISVFGAKEKIEIIYKEKVFEKEFVWKLTNLNPKIIKDKIKDLKPEEGFRVSNGEILD